MTHELSNARRFLNAHADIEHTLMQSSKLEKGDNYPKFGDLVEETPLLLNSDKATLKQYGRLRNALAHHAYRNDSPIADPRDDVVTEIERIRRLIVEPPTLADALKDRERPRIFSPEDPVKDFLELVGEHNYSQSPVKMEQGFSLITTNAVARWFASEVQDYDTADITSPISDVLEHSEVGDRVITVNLRISVVEVINRFSGQHQNGTEPPAALLLNDLPGLPPRALCARSDLPLLYSKLT